MRKLLILPLLVLLSGCVTYYYPETALEDGVYYAEDDPAYVIYQSAYPGAYYYPWVTLDYFYLGFNPYPRYAYYAGFPIGLSFGYSPWQHPYSYFGYYSPVYLSYHHYAYSPAWRPYSGYCLHHRGCGPWGNANHPDRGDKRQAGNDGAGYNRDEDEEESEEARAGWGPPDSLETLKNKGNMVRAPYRRNVFSAPAGYAGGRTMVTRSNETTKIGKSRVQPVDAGSSAGGIVITGAATQNTVTSGGTASGRSSQPQGSRSMSSSVPRSQSTSRPPASSMSRGSSGNRNRAGSSRSSSSRQAPKSDRRPRRDNHD